MEIIKMINLKVILLTSLRIFGDFVSYLITLVNGKKRGTDHLPPITDKIILESVTKLTDKIRKGELTAVDVMEAFCRRIELCEPKVNSVTENRFEAALKEAQELDHKLQQERVSGDHILMDLPLIGIPFAAKDCMAVKGMRLTAGFVPRKDAIQEEDCPSIANLRKAGAIPVVMTNVPELAFWYDSANMLHGRTRNPHDLTRIPGGSSGGIAAIVSYAGAPFGLGSDIAGSIRLPSHFCGIFGHMITPQACEAKGNWPPFSDECLKMLSEGPMCKYSCDLIPILKCLLGERLFMFPKLGEAVDLSNLKITCIESDGGSFTTPVHPKIKEAIRKIPELFSTNHGTKAQLIPYLPHMDEAFDIYMHKINELPNILHSVKMANFEGESNPYAEFVKKLFGASTHTLPMITVSMIEWMIASSKGKKPEFNELFEQFKAKVLSLLEENGVVILPAFPEPAINHYTTILKVRNAAYCSLFSLLQCPITLAPIGMTDDGLPFGVQIIAAPFNDHLSLAVARELESFFGGWRAPSLVCV